MTRREYTVRTIEHTVEATQPWGAFIGDFYKRLAIAEHEYRELHGLHRDQSVPDNALALFPGDDEIVIRFTVKQDVKPARFVGEEPQR